MNALYTMAETSARVREWRLLTGADFAEMDRPRTVVVVSCSPLEVHGPHLPVQTDYAEADAIALRTMELLSDRFDDINFLHMPALYVATDVVPQPGSVAFRVSTVRRVIEDLGRSLAKQGFEHIWVANFHGGPRHFVPIEVACDKVSRRYDVKMVSLFSAIIKKLTGGGSDLSSVFAHLDTIDHDALAGDTHGGAVETSMMLHIMGDYVKPWFKQLERRTVAIKLEEEGKPPLVPVGESTFLEMLRGFREKMKFYEEESYTGAPAAASPEAGAQMLDTLSGHAADTLGGLWTGDLDPKDCRSPLWPYRHAFMSETVSYLFERAVSYRSQVF